MHIANIKYATQNARNNRMPLQFMWIRYRMQPLEALKYNQRIIDSYSCQKHIFVSPRLDYVCTGQNLIDDAIAAIAYTTYIAYLIHDWLLFAQSITFITPTYYASAKEYEKSPVFPTLLLSVFHPYPFIVLSISLAICLSIYTPPCYRCIRATANSSLPDEVTQIYKFHNE